MLTKLLDKMYPLQFLVMTEKYIFVYQPFLQLDISDFNVIFMLKFHLSWKGLSPFSHQPPFKNYGPVKPSPLGG